MSTVPSKQRKLVIQEQGDVDVIQVLDDQSVPEPKDDEVLIKVEYAGVNFIDTYQRAGVYKIPMPATLGNEVSGCVVKAGKEATFAVGDRVAAYTQMGGFAEYAVCPSRRVAKLPDGISSKTAAATILQGLTALTFIVDAHNVQKGEYVLIPAAAGGFGSILTQVCTARGAHVIATVSTEAKAEIARKNGAEHVLVGDKAQDSEEVKRLSNGGVHAVFDGVGAATFESSFATLRRKGSFVSVGNASGAVPPFAPLRLGALNIKLTRPRLDNYVATAEEFNSFAGQLFDLIQQDKLKFSIYKEYEFTTQGLRDAQRDISSRVTTGKLLVPISPSSHL